jgi:GT2 family glycosyltransferase
VSEADEPRFAIVVPTYNSADELDACLGSLTELAVPEGGYRVLVVDGGSTDGTVTVAREHGVEVIEAPGTGVAKARNRGAAEAQAEVLVFVDADCRAPEQLLTHSAERIEEAAVVGAFYEPVPEHGWIARTWLAVERKPAGPVGWVPAGTMAVRRAAFAAVDGFREDLRASEDVDLCRRLRDRGYRVLHEPGMACQHLGQPDALGAFYANEVGRSASLVASVREAEDLDTEHVTLALAVFHLTAPIAVAVALFLVGWWGLATLAFVALPSLAWALYVVPQTGWRMLPATAVLLFVYNIARAWSLVEHRQYRDLF